MHKLIIKIFTHTHTHIYIYIYIYILKYLLSYTYANFNL